MIDATRGDLLALAIVPGRFAAVATASGSSVVLPAIAPDGRDLMQQLELIEAELAPRWVIWSNDTASVLVASGLRLARCWDLAAVHRLLFGGWRADPARIWARLADLSVGSIPALAAVDLFSAVVPDDELGEPIGADGHVRPEWTNGAWTESADRLGRWATLAMTVAGLQLERLRSTSAALRSEATARSESAAELLCAELSADGLPVDRAIAEQIIGSYIGPRPRTDAEGLEQRARRDAEVLRHVPDVGHVDLRSPGQVKSLLRGVGIEVPDTRAWRLEALRETHPLVDSLLVWRKAERVATTYGYGWLDTHVDADGRLRGAWSGSDGAAGRMTASAGLHNLPADLRGAVVAETGHVFVRADLGQIEPRVLAAVSGDASLAAATQADDMYEPVARQLGVDRATAKVAVLGAMYGQTTGHGAQALQRLNAAYPVAMAYLQQADQAAQVSQDLRTYGGRRVEMSFTNANEVSDREARSRAAARGRYGRNALVQGAAAEFFKVWAVTVRARAAAFDARIVLCLHDELLVHAPAAHGGAVAALVDECLQESARRWAPDGTVRFLADTTVLRCWADAKS